MRPHKIVDILAVLLVVGFLTYTGAVFFKPHAVISETAKDSFHSRPPVSSGVDDVQEVESAAANLAHLADTAGSYSDFPDIFPLENSQTDVFISSSHVHLLNTEKKPMPVPSAPLEVLSASSSPAVSTSRTAPSGAASVPSSAVAASTGGSSPTRTASGSGDTSGSSSNSQDSSLNRQFSGRGAGSAPLQVINIADELRKLRPLPKVHYSWGLRSDFISDRDNELMYELARLTHSLSIVGEATPPSQIDNCVYTCARINKTNPEIPCSIGINYSPWHRKFKPEQGFAKPISKKYNYTIFSDRTYHAEIKQFVLKMTEVKRWVNQSNAKYGSDVKIGAILLDCERFYRRENDPLWNETMGEALNAIHVEAVKLFPDARIEWYNRGRFQGPDENRPLLSNYLVDNLIMTGMSCSLYSLPYRTRMQKLFQATCDLADTHTLDGKRPWKGLDVTPWVALNYGMDWEIYKSGERDLKVCHRDYGPWDYPLSASREMGAEINSSVSPYDRAKVVIFFPAPFDSNFPNWGRHFIEYCKGAAQASSQ